MSARPRGSLPQKNLDILLKWAQGQNIPQSGPGNQFSINCHKPAIITHVIFAAGCKMRFAFMGDNAKHHYQKWSSVSSFESCETE